MYKPSPRDATSVAIRIGAFPERNSEREEPILMYTFESQSNVYTTHTDFSLLLMTPVQVLNAKHPASL